jgi:hypothetical protein
MTLPSSRNRSWNAEKFQEKKLDEFDFALVV